MTEDKVVDRPSVGSRFAFGHGRLCAGCQYTDTMATMAGAICGALAGAASGLPTRWMGRAESYSARKQHELAAALVDVAKRKRKEKLPLGKSSLVHRSQRNYLVHAVRNTYHLQ